MRLWSLHPKYLDSKGLVACWREGLLAQAVLLGKTKGYRSHSQLTRFQEQGGTAVQYLVLYLVDIAFEANHKRFYGFDESRISTVTTDFMLDNPKIPVTIGQLEYEHNHLAKKLEERKTVGRIALPKTRLVDTHPLFTVVPGGVESWEKETIEC